MDNGDAEILYDDAAGPLVRPFVATGGRTEASTDLDILALVCTTGKYRPTQVEAYLGEVLLLCQQAVSIAELSAHLHLPAQIVRVLVSDLIDIDAVHANAPQPYVASRELLEKLLAGLQRRL